MQDGAADDSLAMSVIVAPSYDAEDKTKFGVYLPDGVAGQPVQVITPDGVTLEINLPETAAEGDMISFQITEDGQWAPELISRDQLAGLAQEPGGFANDFSIPPTDIGLDNAYQSRQMSHYSDQTHNDNQGIDSDNQANHQPGQDNDQLSLCVERLLAAEQRIEEVVSGASNDALILAQRLEEHQVRYVEEQGIFLGRLETAETFLQQMAPALQGLLARFEEEKIRHEAQIAEFEVSSRHAAHELAKGLEERLHTAEKLLAEQQAEVSRLNDATAASKDPSGPGIEDAMNRVNSVESNQSTFAEQISTLQEALLAEQQSEGQKEARLGTLEAAIQEMQESQPKDEGIAQGDTLLRIERLEQQQESLCLTRESLDSNRTSFMGLGTARVEPGRTQDAAEHADLLHADLLARLTVVEQTASAERTDLHTSSLAMLGRLDAIEKTVAAKPDGRTELKDISARLDLFDESFTSRVKDLEQNLTPLYTFVDASAELRLKLNQAFDLTTAATSEIRRLDNAVTKVSQKVVEAEATAQKTSQNNSQNEMYEIVGTMQKQLIGIVEQLRGLETEQEKLSIASEEHQRLSMTSAITRRASHESTSSYKKQAKVLWSGLPCEVRRAPRDELKESQAGEVFKKQSAFLKQLAAPSEQGREDMLRQLTAPFEQLRSPFSTEPRPIPTSSTPLPSSMPSSPGGPPLGAPRYVPPSVSIEMPALASTEVFDPETGRWQAIEPMLSITPGVVTPTVAKRTGPQPRVVSPRLRGVSPHVRGVSPHGVGAQRGISPHAASASTMPGPPRRNSPHRVALTHFEASMPQSSSNARQRSLTPNRTVPESEILRSPRSRPRNTSPYVATSPVPLAEPLFFESPFSNGGGSLKAGAGGSLRAQQAAPISSTSSFNTTSQVVRTSSMVVAEPLFASSSSPAATQSEPLFVTQAAAKQAAQQGAMVPNSSTGPRIQPAGNAAGWYPQDGIYIPR